MTKKKYNRPFPSVDKIKPKDGKWKRTKEAIHYFAPDRKTAIRTIWSMAGLLIK